MLELKTGSRFFYFFFRPRMTGDTDVEPSEGETLKWSAEKKCKLHFSVLISQSIPQNLSEHALPFPDFGSAPHPATLHSHSLSHPLFFFTDIL